MGNHILLYLLLKITIVSLLLVILTNLEIVTVLFVIKLLQFFSNLILINLILSSYYYHHYYESFQWVEGVREGEESVGGSHNPPLIGKMNFYIEARLRLNNKFWSKWL